MPENCMDALLKFGAGAARGNERSSREKLADKEEFLRIEAHLPNLDSKNRTEGM